MGTTENYKIVSILAIVICAFCSGYYIRDLSATKEILELKNKAQAEIIIQQNKDAENQRQLQSIANQVEKQSYEANKKHQQELTYYRNIINQSGGLYDYGTTFSNSSPSTGSNQTGTSGKELSRESTEFLFQQANKADQVVDQFLQCQKYVNTITNQVNQK